MNIGYWKISFVPGRILSGKNYILIVYGTAHSAAKSGIQGKERFMKTAYRHGDVLLFKVEKASRKGNKITNGVLAYGEVTGHSHRVTGDYDLHEVPLRDECEFDRNNSTSAMLLSVKTSAKLPHEEHHAIDIPAGDYIVLLETEYEPNRWRNVHD